MQPRQYKRIPLRLAVETRGARSEADVHLVNLSATGAYLRGAACAAAALGEALELTFPLPDGEGPVHGRAEVVWIDEWGLGVRFVDLEGRSGDRIAQFVGRFRYRVLLVEPFDAGFALEAERALRKRYEVERVVSDEALTRALETAQAGIVLVGEATYRESARLLAIDALCRDAEHPPPVMLIGAHLPPSVAAIVEESDRLLFAALPLAELELRTLVARSVERHTVAFEKTLLALELKRLLDQSRRENAALRERLCSVPVTGLIGESPAMRQLHELIARVAPFSMPVMVLGETGTGKDLVARAIHAASPRKDRALVAQNCAALNETLLDAELFGSARGAFTGANADRPGLFEAAHGGSIFLDEVGEMSPAMQAKLLRVLQNGEIRRVGETRMREVDVRVIGATHRALDELVASGRFREDLYYRLYALAVNVPPLRERAGDIALLAEHFLAKLAAQYGRSQGQLTPDALALLESHAWNGNVRELEHVMQRVFVLASGERLITSALLRTALGLATPGSPRSTYSEALAQYERSLIEGAMRASGGVIAGAAKALGMQRSTLSRHCKRLGIKS